MKKTVLFVLLVSVLLLFVSCGNTTTEVTTEEAVTTADTPVTTTTPTTTTTTTPTTPEDPDAWKEKVDWESLDNGYNEETDTYQVRIVVQDIYGVGQKRADAAFAEKYGLYYSGKYYYLDYYQFDIIASMKDIEMYAKLEEVKSVGFPLYTPPEESDAWKEKLQNWNGRYAYYDPETETYLIMIWVQDVHGIGRKNVAIAFAKKYGLEYRDKPYTYYMFFLRATMEEIEMYAKLEEVQLISFESTPVSTTN